MCAASPLLATTPTGFQISAGNLLGLAPPESIPVVPNPEQSRKLGAGSINFNHPIHPALSEEPQSDIDGEPIPRVTLGKYIIILPPLTLSHRKYRMTC